jgi:hypothetical protein
VWLVAWLVVDYFGYTTCSGASACPAAHRWFVVDYFASRKLVVSHFAYDV